MLDKWCPLDLAIYCGNHKFVAVMIRTPFDFNTISFTFYEGYRYPSPCNRCGELCSGCFYMEVDLADEHFITHGNNVLHTAARKGHLEIVKIILENARVKNIDINALNGREQNAIQVAKDDPEVVKMVIHINPYVTSGRRLIPQNCRGFPRNRCLCEIMCLCYNGKKDAYNMYFNFVGNQWHQV